MFAVDLLDALAEAAVLLIFDWTPTSAAGDEDNDLELGSDRFTGVNSWSSLDSFLPRSQMNTTCSANNCSSATPRTPSFDGSSFVQVTAEELQMTPFDQPVGGHEYHSWTTERERASCSTSTISSWAVPVRPLQAK
ncbi:uncharacterized protein Tco025E_08395 [Trypanosoma conorhini]|uniref:Secreted protein n=1 Tax=Trypanosoma conorhini TaxID=83891 RepID=A0A3R7N8X2_9TRYP|nr:uncharacterized protein Tco025E_08395 [Trypanosoma conorhini]RNF02357.1 hypothetical protein Tco025E_08395 [Trypanosoma conorhini]